VNRIGLRLIACYLTVLLILLVASGVALVAAHQMRTTTRSVVRTTDALIADVDLRIKLMDDEETGLRGY
jgi:CHASE3 domain sensor protein